MCNLATLGGLIRDLYVCMDMGSVCKGASYFHISRLDIPARTLCSRLRAHMLSRFNVTSVTTPLKKLDVQFGYIGWANQYQ